MYQFHILPLLACYKS